jgi:SAM-dependent methyltransferase
MKLNAVEKLVVNNPVRALSQWRYLTPRLERLGGKLGGGRALELGCGRGIGVEIIFERFGADVVEAFDLDPNILDRARRRLDRYPSDRLRLGVGNATAIESADAAFDAVFDFGAIHHVPDWRDAVSEVHRVLKPGGRFYFVEATSRALGRWASRTFLEHPPPECWFSAEEFVSELERRNLVAQADCLARRRDRFASMGLDLIGVGRVRPDPGPPEGAEPHQALGGFGL